MKIFTPDILAKKKIVLIFLLAILLPALIVGHLSFTTFSKRQEAVRKLLESHLWISGESALKSLEGKLLDHEKEALNPKNFVRFAQVNKTDPTFSSHPIFSEDIAGKLFLLDDNYQIVLPKTGRDDISIIPREMQATKSEYARTLKRAEFFEFSAKSYSRAAEFYRRCILNAPSKQHAALTLEALGRCLLSSKKYSEAYEVYSELSTTYGQLLNKARHPYGILAAFQLHEIERHRKNEENSLKILLKLYKKIRNGVWLINLPTYDFFTTEIKSILSDRRKGAKFPEIHKSYQALRSQQSSYLQALIFADFLRREVAPKIKEKVMLSRIGGEAQPGRLLATWKGEFCLISYTLLDKFQSEKTFYGGFCWDFNSLKKEMFPKVLEELKKDSGLHLRIIDEEGQNILTGKEELTSKDSLSLSYRQFPFPWELLVSQPELNELERTGRREIFFYGVLLAFIVGLMLLGAFLIARDISRESETTRLKTEFVHNISHELKTPLTLIRLYGETLQRKENLTKQKRKESYEIITKESERLSHLINNVLDFSRIEMGRKEFDFKKGNLAKVIQDTLESYRYHLEKKGFVIKEEIASDLPGMNFDGEAVASVLINLLSNAMKFSLNKKEVTVKLFRDNGNAVLQVADKGIGISPKEKSRIFKRFYRSKNETVFETRGSGLGLTLVKHITEAHGGQIKVESEPGKGSIFSVILPFSAKKKG
jgi:signal transduction histidine kinase